MRSTLLLALCAFTCTSFVACHAATVQFGDTGRPPRPDSDDTALDSGGGNGGNGGNGGETGTGGDTGVPAAPVYSGEVDATLSYSDHEKVECSGNTTFTVSDDGSLAGSATCAAGPQSVSGGLQGTVLGSGVHATWRIERGGETVEVPLSGVLDGTTASLQGEVAIGEEATLSVSITASS